MALAVRVTEERDFARLRRDAAPLREEREQYVRHLLNQGTNPIYVRAVGARLVHINRLLGMSSQLRAVTTAEVRSAEENWLHHIAANQSRGVRPSSAYTFRNATENWLRFHNLLVDSDVQPRPFESELSGFMDFLAARQPSDDFFRSQQARISVFLAWAGGQYSRVSDITLIDVDRFLDEKRRAGLKPRSLVSYCSALRRFFRYAATEGWSQPTVARGIRNPPVSTFEEAPLGPSWKDVRRMLTAPIRPTPAELRARAILSLCAMYGLRGAEVRRLMLNDFDWLNERFIVHRAKRGPVQLFPIQYEVGEAVLRYLRFGRPRCQSNNVFVTLKPPYRAMCQPVLAQLVRSRMEALQIDSGRSGSHSLRHACATQLLHRGSSLIDIAEYLGHRSIQSVSIYAKLDKRTLRQVAMFSLAGVR